MFTKTLISFIVKFFTVKQLPTVLFSFITSSFLAMSMEALNKLFFKDADLKNVFIPIAIELFMIGVYLLMVMSDFYFGVRVSVYVKKVKFDYFKVIDSTVKVIATILVTSIVMFISMGVEAMGFEWAWVASIVVLLFLWIIIILNDFLSLGKNQELLTGSKGRIFIFFEKILSVLEKKAISKIDSNSFNFEDNEKDNTTDNN